MRELLLVMALILAPGGAWASEAAPAAADPALERQMMAIANELRCLVCQNQTIADSNAPLAVDLRNQIREQLKAGKSASGIMSYMVERYGDFVLYRPPMKGTTVLLWVGPLLLMIVGLVVLYRRISRRRAEPAALSEADHQAAARLLQGGEAER
ncbi:MAG: cytochrome c-type biogenesis protein CcmH [Betaproteobacteria bacterium]|nr:cytochrome c-type biogenesis protein CcmH [Betaproteobacteria bacterium]